MLAENHQSSPACALTTHPPQVTFFLGEPSVEFHPTDAEDGDLPLPVTSGGESVTKGTGTLLAVAFAPDALPFLPTSAADTTSAVGKADPSVPFAANSAGASPVPTREVAAGVDVATAASKLEVELSALDWEVNVGDDTDELINGLGAVPKAAGGSCPVPVGGVLGSGRSEPPVGEGDDGDEFGGLSTADEDVDKLCACSASVAVELIYETTHVPCQRYWSLDIHDATAKQHTYG
jgi:hypothetical protein